MNASTENRSRGVVVLLVFAALVASVVWAMHAPRFFVFTEQSYRGFWNRAGLMLIHVLGSTFPLFAGPFLLWSGLRGWKPKVHRWVGRCYLVFGSVGVGAGAALSLIAAVKPQSLYVATFTLSLAWFLAAGMALRAIRNAQVSAHRDWVIRSYVITWTFVGCRLAMRLPGLSALGDDAITATVWVSWIVPVLVTEVALQWRKTGPLHEINRA